MKIAATFCLLSCLSVAAAAAPVTPPPNLKTVFESVDRLTAGQRGAYFYKESPLGEFLFEGMTVPENNYKPAILPDGNYIFRGCRRNSCVEKSAVLASPSGEMLAAALAHFPGCMDDNPKAKCSDVPMVTIFLRRSRNQENIAQDMKDWALYFVRAPSFEIKYLPN